MRRTNVVNMSFKYSNVFINVFFVIHMFIFVYFLVKLQLLTPEIMIFMSYMMNDILLNCILKAFP